MTRAAIIGKIQNHTEISRVYFPVGRDEVAALDAGLKAAPRVVSWIEARMYVWWKMSDGYMPTVREIAAWTMWPNGQSANLRNVVIEQNQEWAERHPGWSNQWTQDRTETEQGLSMCETENRTHDFNDSNNLVVGKKQKPNRNRTETEQKPNSRAFLISKQELKQKPSLEGQGQIAPGAVAQDKGIPKEDISTMWATMCGIRADVFPGSQRVLALLPARDQKLRACLRIQKLTTADLVHLTRWFFTADENQWVRDKGYHFDTMLRSANVARYYEKAQGWSTAKDEADTERRLAEGY